MKINNNFVNSLINRSIPFRYFKNKLPLHSNIFLIHVGNCKIFNLCRIVQRWNYLH